MMFSETLEINCRNSFIWTYKATEETLVFSLSDFICPTSSATLINIPFFHPVFSPFSPPCCIFRLFHSRSLSLNLPWVK